MRVLLLSISLVFAMPMITLAKGASKTDAQIAQILIDQSISRYSGSCPCPYNTARNGSKCGKRSAYSKPGGASPLCYKSDVTAKMIERYRNS